MNVAEYVKLNGHAPSMRYGRHPNPPELVDDGQYQLPLTSGSFTQTGVKHDGGKLRYTLLPPAALEAVVLVLMHGADKYGDENWRKVLEGPQGKDRYLDACYRHIEAHRKGQVWDADSGLPHLAHAVCSLLFLLEA